MRLIRYITILASVCFVISLFVLPKPLIQADFSYQIVNKNTNEYALEVFQKEFAGDLVMSEIVECESNFRQFDENGEVLIGITKDIGIMQIAPQYWLEEAIKLGYDIYTVEGNIAMGKYILKKQGYGAWACFK